MQVVKPILAFHNLQYLVIKMVGKIMCWKFCGGGDDDKLQRLVSNLLVPNKRVLRITASLVSIGSYSIALALTGKSTSFFVLRYRFEFPISFRLQVSARKQPELERPKTEPKIIP